MSANLQALASTVLGLINDAVVPLIFGVAFLTFLYGVFKYFILGAANEDDRESGRSFILWGIIGFVVMLSLWGLVKVFQNTFGLTASNAPAVPTIGGGGGGGGYVPGGLK